MSIQMLEAIVVSDQHLDPKDVVAYVDGVARPSERVRIESHLVTCAECRDEVADAGRIIATLPRPRSARRTVIITAAAIAATLLVFLWPGADRDLTPRRHRESPITTTIAPTIITPIGAVESADRFVWSSVPHAGSYEVRVFDPDGSVIWQGQTRDTVLTPPPTTGMRANRSYYWKVEAHIGFERSTSTELVEFSIRPQSRQ
jgi:hypothetical protein